MDVWTTIRCLHAQGKGIRATCRELDVARNTVRAALRQGGVPRYQRPHRPNPKLVPFEAQVRTWYFRDHLIGSRIIRELRALGYSGSASALYGLLRQLRAVAPSTKATERFETPPGYQAQFDWSPYTVELGGQLTKIIVFGMTLGYSRRKHYTVSLNETQPSVLEAIEQCLVHFGGAPKELLVDNAKVFVLDANLTRFRWNPQFLELCGHYRVTPRACQPYRPRTKGKVERPFFYLEQQFIKGTRFDSFQHLLDQLAVFERDDLDVRVHGTTQERPLDRFEAEAPRLTPLPEQRFVGTLALTRKVSWDCLVSYQGSRYSVPAVYAGKHVWLLASRGAQLVILDSRRQMIAEHTLSGRKGAVVACPEHYESLRRGVARTTVLLSREFLACFPGHADYLERLIAQHKQNPAAQLRGVMALAALYEPAAMERALAVAMTYNTYSHVFLRGVLESTSRPRREPVPADPRSRVSLVTPVQSDLGRYQRLLEVIR